jgi:hypothetical protein
LDAPYLIARNNDILNSTNDKGGHSQSLEPPLLPIILQAAHPSTTRT